MRALIALYLIIGAVLLALGFFASGPCDNKNGDVLNNTVFVLTWPVSFYDQVLHGQITSTEWLHKQACEGGLGPHRNTPAPPPAPASDQPSPNSGPAPTRN
jgi:hypothetical protein